MIKVEAGKRRRPFSELERRSASGKEGFTLLEVLVAVAILAATVSLVLRLFSADLKTISASEEYVVAAARAQAKMREILDDDTLTEKSLSELTNDGYRIDVSVTDTMKERTENLQVELMDITMTIRWIRGMKEKSMTLRTMKAVQKQI
ncbi:MAG TPA: prepilin-type N-terminal cleavage/methylation domain-containing protein [Thermodesulfovibrionales bacterium]|nr:prepilin-type N-terminal cleavage/methylation domain-containing protein [Thermodesulfovibrionales bacterium]